MDQRDKTFEIPDEITVELKKPLQKAAAGAEVLTVLRFRAPTVGQMKQITKRQQSQGNAEAGILLLSLLSLDGLTPPEIERMNFLDMQICQEALQPFLELKAPSAALTDSEE